MFHSISRTLSPALAKPTSRKHRSLNPSLALPTPPQSPNDNCNAPLTHVRTSSDPSEEDDFVEVKLTESEKQYISQIEEGNEPQENQIGTYLTALAHRPLPSSSLDYRRSTGTSIAKLVREAKEWQAFFRIGKHDFEHERKHASKRDSSLLASSLKCHSTTGGPQPTHRPEPVVDGGRVSSPALNASVMKRVKSDQIVYHPPTPELAPEEPVQSSSENPVQPSITSLRTNQVNSSVDELRRSIQMELGLSPADVDVIDQFTTQLPSDSSSSSLQRTPPASICAPSPSNDECTSTPVAAVSTTPSRSQENSMADPSKSACATSPSVSNSPVQRRRRKVTVNDFEIIRVLGKGCAGKVLMVKYRKPSGNHPSHVYAMKSIRKNHVLSHRELQHTLTEQSVLRRVADKPESNPFIVRLWWSFHDKDHLFLVMDFHPGGDLATQLARWGRLGRDRARFYAAEITEGVTSLHRSGVIYRDLKPENILIAFDGHIVLTDFGLSKQFERDSDGERLIEGEEERTLTFCGTAEYLAPEVLLGEPYSYEVDWWSFGTMLYEMLTGLTPFWSEDHATMYRRVLHDELVFNEDSNRVMDHDTKTLLRGLLQRNPAVRMTGDRIKKHPYFGMIDWDHVQHKRYIPPYVPAVNPNDATDTQNFDETFLAMEPTYVQDDDPPQPGTEDQREGDDEAQAAEDGGADVDSNVRKIEPQQAVDENGLDVFDGYSYLAPSHERDSIILEDEEIASNAEGQEGMESKANHSKVDDDGKVTETGESDDSVTHGQRDHSTTPMDENEEPDQSALNDQTGEDDWDVVVTPENGQTDSNGRLGKKMGNTLFARGVVDKYKLRMKKFNENSAGGNTFSTAPTGHSPLNNSPKPISGSKPSFIKTAQNQFNSIGNQSSLSSIGQLSGDSPDHSTSGAAAGNGAGMKASNGKKRFTLRPLKKAQYHHQQVGEGDLLSPTPPPPNSKKSGSGMLGLELSSVGSHFLKRSSQIAQPQPPSSSSQLPTPALVNHPSEASLPPPSSSASSVMPAEPHQGAGAANMTSDHSEPLIGGSTINPKKKKALVGALV